MKALETDLVGAGEVKADMERRLAGFEAERLHIVKESGAAIARTPAWTSGFLDGAHSQILPYSHNLKNRIMTISTKQGNSSCIHTVVLRWYNSKVSYIVCD
jgi:hypothetical protein